AFDPATGKQRWATQIGDDTPANGFVVAGGYVFTTGSTLLQNTTFVVALDAATGKSVWRYQTSPGLSAIAVGPVLTTGPIPPSTSTASVPVATPSPSLAQLKVYVANVTLVTALHAADGKRRWQIRVAPTKAVGLVTVNGIVAYACRDEVCPTGATSGVHGL